MPKTLPSSVLVSCVVWFVALASCGPSVVVDRNAESDGGPPETDARLVDTLGPSRVSTAVDAGLATGTTDGGSDAISEPGAGMSGMPGTVGMDGGLRPGTADAGGSSPEDSRAAAPGSDAGTGGEPTTGQPDGPSGLGDEGHPPDAPVDLRAPSDWLGVWSGAASYTAVVLTDPLTGMVHREEKQIDLTVQVDDFDQEDAAEGWAVIVGRISAAECVLSAAFSAMVFFGDSISHPAFPVVSASGGGVDQSGRMVGFAFSGERRLDWIVGKLNFESESQRQPPCDSRELAFTLSRTR